MKGAMGLVAWRELTEGLRSKAFKVSVAITVVLVLATSLLPRFVSDGDGRATYDVAVPEGAPPALASALAASGDALGVTLRVRTSPDVPQALVALRDGDVDLVLNGDTVLVDGALPAELEAAANRARALLEQDRRATAAGLTALQSETLSAPLAPLRVTSVSTDDTSGGDFAVASITVVLLFLALSVYGGAVLNGVLTEKSTRIIEVLLSSVRPTDILGGKLLGIGGLGMIQVLAMAGVAAATTQLAGTADLPASTLPTVALSVLWFVLGFGLYSSFYAMAGSLVSRQEDAQAAATPVTLLMTVGYVANFAVVLPNPDGLAARIFSLVPLTAPTTIVARSALGDVAWWEHVVAVAATLVSIVVVVRIAARVYAGAALRFGGKVKLRHVLGGDGA